MPPSARPRTPRSGDVLHVTRAASVQFAQPFLFRVIRLHDWSTHEGWIWLDGYELSASGDAVERRSIWVQVSGLRWVDVDRVPRFRPRAVSNGGGRSYGQPLRLVRERTG